MEIFTTILALLSAIPLAQSAPFAIDPLNPPIKQIEEVAANIVPLYLGMVFSDKDVKSTMEQFDSCFESNSDLFFESPKMFEDVFKLVDFCNDPETNLINAGTDFLNVVLSSVQKCPSVEISMAKGMKGFYQRITDGAITFEKNTATELTMPKFDGKVPVGDLDEAERLGLEAVKVYPTVADPQTEADLKGAKQFAEENRESQIEALKLAIKRFPITLNASVDVANVLIELVGKLLKEEGGLLRERLSGEDLDIDDVQQAARLGVKAMKDIFVISIQELKEPIENLCQNLKLVVNMVEGALKGYDQMYESVVGMAA